MYFSATLSIRPDPAFTRCDHKPILYVCVSILAHRGVLGEEKNEKHIGVREFKRTTVMQTSS